MRVLRRPRKAATLCHGAEITKLLKFHLKILMQTVALQLLSETSLKLLFPFSLVRQGSTAFLLLLTTASLFSAQQPASVQQAAEDYRQGLAAFSRNDLRTALQHFQNVVRLNPETEPGHLMLGFVLAKLGRTTEAIPELEKALALNPNDNDARMNLALAYEQTNSPAKAIPHFLKLDQ